MNSQSNICEQMLEFIIGLAIQIVLFVIIAVVFGILSYPFMYFFGMGRSFYG